MQYMLGDLMFAFSRVVHSIVCCRIILNLRRAASPRDGLAVIGSTGLVFAAAPEPETNQADTIQLEGYDVGSSEDSHHQDCVVECSG